MGKSVRPQRTKEKKRRKNATRRDMDTATGIVQTTINERKQMPSLANQVPTQSRNHAANPHALLRKKRRKKTLLQKMKVKQIKSTVDKARHLKYVYTLGRTERTPSSGTE